ncbi:MAG: DUF4390 domain-containing protein [bacterium]
MRTFAKDFFSLALIATLAVSGSARAQSEIRVERIQPQVNSDRLTVSADFLNLFSKRITGTIQSGLPSIIEIQIRLIEGEKKQIARKPLSKSIEYNLWEERYIIRSADTTVTTVDFSQVKLLTGRITKEPLAHRRDLSAGKRYRIEIRVGIIPISSRQADKVSDWLQNPNQTEEVVASDNRSSGFRLNINKLVSFFVSNKKGSQFRSKWFSSRVFRLIELEP